MMPSAESNAKPSQKATTPAVRITGLVKHYEGCAALNGVNLTVGAGEVVAIVGPSGAGKTTLLRCMALLSLPDAGTIELFGATVFDGDSPSHDGHATDLRTRHRDVLARVGIVFQSLNLWPHRTVLQNVADPLVRVRGLARREAQDKAAQQLEMFGLSQALSRKPDTLSGGEKQRVALARSLAGNPDLLLLDEITSALDLERVADILMLLRTLAQSDITLVLVTHELMFASEVAHQVLFMDSGKVVEAGPPKEILTVPKTRRVRDFIARMSASMRITIAQGDTP
jgi:ABC-type polar amino acid transport system ATPase subunit